MANKFAKDFENSLDRNFGSFEPKSSPLLDETGAKQTGNNQGNKGTNAASEGQRKANSINPLEQTKQDAKADVKAALAEGSADPNSKEEQEKQSQPMEMAGKGLAKGASKKGLTKAGKALGSKAGSKVGLGAIGSKTTGALTGLKGLGAKMLGGVKGAAASVSAAVTKAGGVVASALNVSASVGTAIVLSGTLAAATIPTAGLIGHGVVNHTQRTDGCVPEEYDDPGGGAGAKGAVEWAIKIANDDSFAYGLKPATSSAGCYFCGTNCGPNKYQKPAGYEKTYVCMSFVTAAYAHGANDPEVLALCESGNCLDSHDGLFEQVSCFRKIGLMKDLTVDDLQPGDVFVHYASDDQNGHMSIYAGDGRIVDAQGGSSGSFGPDSIALRDEGTAESFLRGTWNLEPEKNFVMRYIGRGHGTSTASTTAHMTSSTVTPRQNVQATIDWARQIAADDRFTYGQGYGGYYDCPVCHHCTRRADLKYTCNPFVAAAYAHGTNDPLLMANGHHKIRTSDWNFEGERSRIWQKVGLCKDLSWEDVEPGDILIQYAAGVGGHAWLYGGNDEILEATSGGGIVDKQTGAKRRFQAYQRRSQDFVMRYIGDSSGGSPLFGSAAYNAQVAEMTADDGCGGEMSGALEEDAYIGKGMKKITAANGEEYIILDCDLEAVKKLGKQGSAQCYIYSIGYCDLILGGKFRCSIEGSADAKHAAMRVAYGRNASPTDANGDFSKINGTDNHESSTQGVLNRAINEIKQGRPVILWTQNSMSGTHFLCACGWRADAGANPTWDDLVCIDPAFNGTGDDGLRTMKGYPDGSTHWIGTCENWTPGEGQTRRSN